MIEFALLGPLEVRRDGELVPIRAGKERALLALLLLRANEVVDRARLIDELWGETPPETAATAVQVYVSRLRKLLPRELLLTQPGGYRLAVDAEAVDALRFERLLRTARDAAPSDSSTRLREALALWRGTPLAEFAEEPFAWSERRRLEELRLTALEERVEADLKLGRHGELTSELEALVAQYPHRERLRGQLMLALYRAGRQTDALAAYRDARAALQQLGLEPTAALNDLQRRILRQDADLDADPAPSALPGPLAPTPTFAFVGRERELATLRAAAQHARRGAGRAVIVAGEPGVGKTRLIRELASELAVDGVRVLYGVSDAEVVTPYQPLREWIEFLVRTTDAHTMSGWLGPDADPLARLVPTLARGSHIGEPDRYTIQSAATSFLLRVARSAPLVLVADDLHWADAETLHLFVRLARTAPEAPLLVLGTFRERDAAQSRLAASLAELGRLDSVTQVSLASFSVDEVEELVRVSASAAAAPDLAAAIQELTSGTALFVCELWRELAETGAVERSGRDLRLARPLTELRASRRLADVVRGRLIRVAPRVRELVETAAVAGPRVELRVLEAAVDQRTGSLAEDLEEARRAAFLDRLPDSVAAVRFTHELMRRTIYDEVDDARRRLLHRSVGEALEAVHGGDLSAVIPELAHHFTEAASSEVRDRGVEYQVLAARSAAAAAAFGQAAEHLRTALELGVQDDARRAELHVELGYLFEQAGRAPEAHASLTAGLAAATELADRGIAAYAAVNRLRSMTMQDPLVEPSALEGTARQALQTLAGLGDPRGSALAGRALALTLRRQGRLGEAVAASEAALADALTCGEREVRQQIVGTLVALLCDGPTPVDEAIARCEQLLQLDPHDRTQVAIVERASALLLAMAGRTDEAREPLERSSRVIDTLDNSAVVWAFRRLTGDTRLLLGDRDGATSEYEAQWRYYRSPPIRERDRVYGCIADSNGMRAAYLLAHLRADEDRWDDVESCLAHAAEVPEPPYFLDEQVARVAARARLDAHRGSAADAVASAERAVAIAEPTDAFPIRALAWLALAVVRQSAGRDDAADALARAVEVHELKGNLVGAALARATFGRDA